MAVAVTVAVVVAVEVVGVVVVGVGVVVVAAVAAAAAVEEVVVVVVLYIMRYLRQELLALRYWWKRRCGPVVRALALRSGEPGFKTRSDHSLNLILVVPGSNSQLHL